MGVIRHLREVLDIDVHEARGVVPEGLERRDLTLDRGLQALELGDLLAAQAAVHSRSRRIRVDELPCDSQQVTQGQQQQHAAQLDDDHLLTSTERGARRVGAM